MDALDILTNPEDVIPFFQPIFSADEHRVIGYEILGRFRMGTEISSLGPFFNDKQIPEDYRLEVDNTVLRKALEKAARLKEDVLWFVNRDAELLMHDNGDQFLQLILEFREQGIKPEQIVLEISERNYDGELDHLDHLLTYYRTYGIKIAIGKMGHDSSSHLDRLGQLAPEILKVDLQALNSSATGRAYQDILYSLSLMARKIGATLLFENIETVFQLQFAWKNGGRYYQGFYLKKPDAQFTDSDILKEWLRNECLTFIVSKKKKLESVFLLSEEFHTTVQELLNRYRKIVEYSELLAALSKEMSHMAFRMYVCDEDGYQKSPNIFKHEDGWSLQPEYSGKNWSWRPYFLENIIKMRFRKKGILSDRYSDIETGEVIRTFSMPLDVKDYLFIDLDAGYLYGREGLL
ncbi:EAL domain-containing protein [Bacillus sp. T33-2]|uniref:EAL domain-containing protein n=1 Tax=Bacillus sp. T33-2 TaxID=2054168 RepID=UPI000C764733|nr:EAL domain-containing protein [Bacillus sp. T33-2]PLR97468.1 diguanylate phosphodiesterase [Bacillus sp. T33-2]